MSTKLYLVICVSFVVCQSISCTPVPDDLPSSEILDYPIPNIAANLKDASERISRDLNAKQDEIRSKVEEQLTVLLERALNSLENELDLERGTRSLFEDDGQEKVDIDEASPVKREVDAPEKVKDVKEEKDKDVKESPEEKTEGSKGEPKDIVKEKVEDLKNASDDTVKKVGERSLEDAATEAFDKKQQQILNQIDENNKLLADISKLEKVLPTEPVLKAPQLPDLQQSYGNAQNTFKNAFAAPWENNYFQRSLEDDEYDDLEREIDGLHLNERSLPDDIVEPESIPAASIEPEAVETGIVPEEISVPGVSSDKIDEIVSSVPESIDEKQPLTGAEQLGLSKLIPNVANFPDNLQALKVPGLPLVPQGESILSETQQSGLLPFRLPKLFTRSIDDELDNLDDVDDELLEDEIDHLGDDIEHPLAQRDVLLDEEENPEQVDLDEAQETDEADAH